MHLKSYPFGAAVGAAMLLLGLPFCAEAQDLHIFMTASSEVVGPGDHTTYTLTVTNTAPVDLLGVLVVIQLPDHITRFPAPPGVTCPGACDPNVIATWSVGTLASGQSRTIFYNPQIAANAPETRITSSATASASNASDISTSLDVSIDPTPLLRLSVAPDPGPVMPGAAFTYTVTFANIGSISPSRVVLTMPVPVDTTFVSASDGGTVGVDGVVTWNIGLLGAAEGGQVRLAVDVDATLADGDVIEAVAELDPGVATEFVVRSSAVTPVRVGSPLRFEYAVSETATGDLVDFTYTLTAANMGPVDLLDVTARILVPGGGFFADPVPGLTCARSSCDVVAWSVGTLAPGQSRTTYLRRSPLFTLGLPGGEVLRSMLTAEASNAGQVLAAQDVQVDPTPLLRLSVAPDPGPATPGEPFTYTITFGNIGSASPFGVVLTMPLPAGTSFVSASDGGTVGADGVVTWDIGLLAVGVGRAVRLTLLPEAGLEAGRLLVARAELDPGLAREFVVRSSAVTPVRAGSPLRLEYGVSQTAVNPTGGSMSSSRKVTYTITAANTGPVDLLNVEALIFLPGGTAALSGGPGITCPTGTCDFVAWSVGTLAPGQNRTRFFIMDSSGFTLVRAFTAPAGDVLRSMLTAEASNAGQVLAALDVHADVTPLLRLSVAPDPGPATPGKPFAYTITFGNVGSSIPSGVVLTMPVPAGTTFVSASDGGTVGGDGIVTWDIGLLEVGKGGQFRLVAMPDASLADGFLLTARSEINPNLSTESVVRSLAVTPVRVASPLRFEYAVSQTPTGPGGEVTYAITAANTGPVDLLDVTAEILLPTGASLIDPVPGFICFLFGVPSLCPTWSIGTLTPGQTRTTFFRPRIGPPPTGGEVLRSMLSAEASNAVQVLAAQDVQVDPRPLLRLSVAPDPGPAVPGEPFTYTITFGNVGPASPSNVVLTMPLPAGTTFVSASDGGTVGADGVVTWNVGLLGAGQGGRFQLVVTPDASLAEGSLLVARSRIDANTNTEAAVRSSAVTPVRSGSPPLRFRYDVSQTAAGAGDELIYTLTATNTGPIDLFDVAARILLPGSISGFVSPPGFECGNFGCAANEAVTWSAGALAPGQSQSVSFTTSVINNAVLGSVLRSPILATTSNAGTDQVIVQQDVLLVVVTTTSTTTSTTTTMSSVTTTTMLPVSGDCGDPDVNGTITASDALTALRTGVGSATCALCFCDIDGSGAINATDALQILRAAVGVNIALLCPSCP